MVPGGTKQFLKRAKEIELEAAARQHRKADGVAPHGGGHDESNWLVSYADMMTLLCGFFIMLFSMAKMDEPKYEKLKESVSKQFGGKYEAPPSPAAVAETMAKFVTQVLQEAGVEKETTVRYDALGVSVAFQSTVFFDTLSADVKSEGHIVLAKLIDSISREQQKSNKAYKIVIEGHTDSRPVLGGPFPSNWELSGARASRVVRMFLERGFAADKLTSIGYADTRPELPSRTPSGTWDEPALAKNRRVVLRILEPSVDSIPFPTGAAPLPGAAGAAQPMPAAPAGHAPAAVAAPSVAGSGVSSPVVTAPAAQ